MDCHGGKCNVIEYTRSIFPCKDNTRNVIASECEAIQNSVGLLAQATISNLFFAYVSFSFTRNKRERNEGTVSSYKNKLDCFGVKCKGNLIPV